MKLTKGYIMRNYDAFDPRVTEYLKLMLDEIRANGDSPSNYTTLVFDLLAAQLHIYYTYQDKLLAGDDSSQTIEMISKTTKLINKLTSEFSLSIYSRARLNISRRESISEEETAAEAIERLVG